MVGDLIRCREPSFCGCGHPFPRAQQAPRPAFQVPRLAPAEAACL